VATWPGERMRTAKLNDLAAPGRHRACSPMACMSTHPNRCETCGNDYDKAFQVVMEGQPHTFDSFECAAQALAPTCNTCGLRILGHGLEKDGWIYCCAHCAAHKGAGELRDRA
jgi:hypothetical protein